jgi:hypothetical protein
MINSKSEDLTPLTIIDHDHGKQPSTAFHEQQPFSRVQIQARTARAAPTTGAVR